MSIPNGSSKSYDCGFQGCKNCGRTRVKPAKSQPVVIFKKANPKVEPSSPHQKTFGLKSVDPKANERTNPVGHQHSISAPANSAEPSPDVPVPLDAPVSSPEKSKTKPPEQPVLKNVTNSNLDEEDERVPYPPFIGKPPSISITPEGNILFEAVVSCSEEPHVEWYFEDALIRDSDRHVVQSKRIYRNYSLTLLIKNPTRLDNGQYKVIASNEDGVSEQCVKHVLKPSRFAF